MTTAYFRDLPIGAYYHHAEGRVTCQKVSATEFHAIGRTERFRSRNPVIVGRHPNDPDKLTGEVLASMVVTILGNHSNELSAKPNAPMTGERFYHRTLATLHDGRQIKVDITEYKP
jgi:hypothetical protein